MSIFPISAQIVVKSATVAGTLGAIHNTTSAALIESRRKIWQDVRYVRVEQSRSATPRTSTSQHWGVPEAQTVVWRVSILNAGVAREMPRKAARVKKEVYILIILVWLFDLWIGKLKKLEVCCRDDCEWWGDDCESSWVLEVFLYPTPPTQGSEMQGAKRSSYYFVPAWSIMI